MIVVTTPTGMIGQQVVDTLLAANAAVRVIVRDPARLPARFQGRVEVVAGSHDKAEVVEKAFQGAETVFWLVPADHTSASVEAAYVDFSRPACAAFGPAGVKRVVGVSALGRGSPLAAHAGYVTGSLKMDDLIAATGISFRTLTMPGFMDNALRQVELIKTQGMISWPVSADLKAPAVATRDIAAAAARLLLDPSWGGQKDVPLLGPEDLSFNDMAAIMTEVLGKPVRFQEMPVEALRSRLIGNGYSDAMAQGMADMMTAKANGLDNAEPRTPAATTPTSFRQWCEDVLKPAMAG